MTADTPSKKAKRVQRHPATVRLFQDAAARFMDLRLQHRTACDRMWAGTLASNFTTSEIALLSDYLCPNDHVLLKSVQKASR
jgi:hypothetical protein